MYLTPYLMIFLLAAVMGCGKENKTGAHLLTPPATASLEVAPPEPTKALVPLIKSENISFSIRRSVELESNLSNKKEFIEGLNKHVIYAEIQDAKDLQAMLSCKDQKDKDSRPWFVPFFNLDSGARASLSVINMSTDPVAQYHCEVLDKEGAPIHQEILSVKRDVLVKGGDKTLRMLPLKSGDSLGALVIDEDSTLFTEGADLAVSTTIFLSARGSKIQTFKEDTLSSPADTEGRSGGTILIEAKKSLGELNVTLLGKHGGEITSVDNSYADFVMPKNCTYGNYVHTFRFSQKGRSGLKGGDSGSFVLKSVDQSMSVLVNKIPGRGGIGQMSLNPASELLVRYTADDNALGRSRAPVVGVEITEAWRERDYNALGIVCFVETIGSHGRFSVFKYTVMNFQKLPPLPRVVAERLQRGEAGATGKELESCIYNDTLKTKDCR
jgi:hypothetical protein